MSLLFLKNLKYVSHCNSFYIFLQISFIKRAICQRRCDLIFKVGSFFRINKMLLIVMWIPNKLKLYEVSLLNYLWKICYSLHFCYDHNFLHNYEKPSELLWEYVGVTVFSHLVESLLTAESEAWQTNVDNVVHSACPRHQKIFRYQSWSPVWTSANPFLNVLFQIYSRRIK